MKTKPVNKKAFHNAETQVFRRWTRKGYAAFVSMKKQVKISCLRLSYGLLVSSDEYAFSHSEFVNYADRDNCDDEDLESLFLLLLKNEFLNYSCTKENITSSIISFRNGAYPDFLTKGKLIL